MSSSVNGKSKNGKPKQSKNGKNEANSKNGNTNGESLLVPIKKIHQENFKTCYKTDLDLIVYDKGKGLKAEGLSENISEEQMYFSLHEERKS